MKYRANNMIKAIIVVFIISLTIIVINAVKIFNNQTLKDNIENELINNEEILALNIETIDEKNEIKDLIYNNFEIFYFYARIFAIDLENIENELININDNIEFNEKDIANSGIEYDDLEINLIEFLFDLESKKPELFDNNIKKNYRAKKYTYNLINYFSNLYDIDYQILASIAYVESGDLNATSMLNKNNIYGGMANNRQLLGYKNMAYGVLSYVRLMKTKYYDKGLDTVDKIGYVFNPVHVNGTKIVNPNWLSKVNSILPKFDNSKTISKIKDIDTTI